MKLNKEQVKIIEKIFKSKKGFNTIILIGLLFLTFFLNDFKIEDVVQQTTKSEISVSSYGDSTIHFIDTGNSDAILIENNNEFALIDGGDNDDESYVCEYLKNNNVSKLKYVIATHNHADHIGGLDAVVYNFEIENIFVSNGSASSKTYRDFIESMSNKGLNPSVPIVGSKFNLGNGTFEVLSAANTDNVNNTSIVLLYTNGNDKILLMGDAEEEIESVIKTTDVDLIKVGHHGSSSSSSEEFIKKVNPEYAVIMCGENNKYNHPHRETLEVLNKYNIDIYRSDKNGDIIVNSSGNGIIISTEK